MAGYDTDISSSVADQLLIAWESGPPDPEFSEYANRAASLAADSQAELCLLDQAYRWHRRQPLRVEDYLRVFPAIAADRKLVLELLYGEVRQRRRTGRLPGISEFAARFPDLASELRQQLEVSVWIDGVSDLATRESPDRGHPDHWPTGQFGDYVLDRVVARGGMGVVYRARHLPLNREVALKMIRMDRLARDVDCQRFHNESLTIARLDHPHIVPIFDVGEVSGIHYFTMKLMEGGDLQQRAAAYHGDPRAAAALIADVADAVHYAHDHGILHRDLKPSNVLLDESGRAYVTDFGLAMRLDEDGDLTRTGELLGTPRFIAPELLSRRPDPFTVAADVYSLGAILYFLLTGKPPFDEPNVLALMESVRDRDPQSPREINPSVDRDLELVCLKALEKRPDQRYPSAVMLAVELRRYLAGECVQARPLTWTQRQWRWVRRHPSLAALSGVTAVVTFCLLSLLAFQTVRLESMRVSQEEALAQAQVFRADASDQRAESARLRASTEALQHEAERAVTEARHEHDVAMETSYATSLLRADMARRTGDVVQFADLMDSLVPSEGSPDRRGFEWFLLDEVFRPGCDRLATLRGPIRCVRYSPDGAYLAAAGDPGAIELFDVATNQRRYAWPNLTTVRDLAFSPDGKQLVAVGDDGMARFYRLDTGESSSFHLGAIPLWQVVFVGPQHQMAIRDQDGLVRLLDRPGGTLTEPLNSKEHFINCIAGSPDLTWLIGGGTDGDLHVWDLATRQTLYDFDTGTVNQVKCIAVSPDGTMVATGGTDQWVRIARLAMPWSHEWNFVGLLFDHPQQIAFSNDGRLVAGCDKNGAARIWNLHAAGSGSTDEPAWAWQAHQRRGYALQFHPQHLDVATGGQANHVAVWHLSRGEEHRILGGSSDPPNATRGMVFLAQGNRLAAAAESGIEVWDVQSGELNRPLPPGDKPWDFVACTADGRYLAVGRKSRGIEVWKRSGDAYQRQWGVPDRPCDDFAFSPGGDVLAVADWTSNVVAIYTTDGGDLERSIPARQVWDVAFSPGIRDHLQTC